MAKFRIVTFDAELTHELFQELVGLRSAEPMPPEHPPQPLLPPQPIQHQLAPAAQTFPVPVEPSYREPSYPLAPVPDYGISLTEPDESSVSQERLEVERHPGRDWRSLFLSFYYRQDWKTGFQLLGIATILGLAITGYFFKPQVVAALTGAEEPAAPAAVEPAAVEPATEAQATEEPPVQPKESNATKIIDLLNMKTP